MPTDTADLTPARFFRLLQEHRQLLIGPAIVGAVLAAVSTFVLPRDWRAEQGLLIRSDAAGYTEQRLGKFTDLAEMKTIQETLLELARSKSSVVAVLEEVDGKAPSAQDIADFRDKLRFAPPGGAEFGKTEVFYLGFLDPKRDRAVAVVDALARELDARLNELRDQRAASLEAEVERSALVAREQLHTQVEQLSAFEQSVGADLLELRHLTSPNGGQSEFSQRALALAADRRRLQERRQQNEALLAELEAAATDPSRILITPDSLLVSQPGLRRLKNGLVDAQLTVARTAGARTANHPYVVAARRSQEAVQAELIRELPAAIAGVKLELQVAERRDAQLAAKLNGLRGRSAELASQRSQYAELVASVESQTRVLEGALKQLADAKAHRAGANSASLLSKIDGVETGVYPEGPGRTVVTAAGGVAGLLLGFALVFVLHAPQPTPVATSVAPAAKPVANAQPDAIAAPISPWAFAQQSDRPEPSVDDSPWAIESPAAAADADVDATTATIGV